MARDPSPPPSLPRVKPALRRLWRDGATLQLGLEPHRAVVVGGFDASSARLVEALDGTRDLAQLGSAAQRLGISATRVDELVRILDRAGALDDGAEATTGLAAWPPVERDRLGPDLAAASVVRGGRDGGVRVLDRRRASAVAVHGAGRIGASVVALLAAAGVGTVAVTDSQVLRGGDVAPGGAGLADRGSRRQDAALRAARRVAPTVRARLPPGRDQPDLAVLSPGTADATDLAAALVRSGVPHLVATVRDGTGIVGPLVLPGRSSCLRCHELHRCDRDPAWPQVAAQLAAPPPSVAPCDVALAAAVSALAVLQALAFLDGDADSSLPPTVDGTLEIAQEDGRTRRRGWSVHPLCGCDWQQG